MVQNNLHVEKRTPGGSSCGKGDSCGKDAILPFLHSKQRDQIFILQRQAAFQSKDDGKSPENVLADPP